MIDFQQQLVIEGIKLLGTVVIGGILASVWTARQKHREHELADLDRLYQLYGELLAVARLWKSAKKDASTVASDERKELLLAAVNAEAGIESLLVKVAAEKRLTPEDYTTLGDFRQASQSVREAITSNDLNLWKVSDDKVYLAYKDGASRLAAIISSRSWRRPTEQMRKKSLREITHYRHERLLAGKIQETTPPDGAVVGHGA